VATYFYPGGLGGTVDLVATNKPFYGIDSVAWYVHFATGVDAVSPAGRDKQTPLKTLRQAVTNATGKDVIVLLDGHEEVIAGFLDVSKEGLVIVGCGQTAGVPNVKLTNDSSTDEMIVVGGPNCQIRNVRILPNLQLNTRPRIIVGQFGFIMDGCYVECGVNDAGPALEFDSGASYSTVSNTTFISVATSLATRPKSGLVMSPVSLSGLRLSGAEFSDGLFGFTDGYALNLSAGTMTSLRGDSVSLLLGASAKLGPAASGYIIPTVTGGGAIDI
jgi:hypothetical protein